MKTLSLTLALLASIPLAAAAQVSKEDLKKLAAAGISDEVILSYVKSNGGVAKLSAEDVIELKQAGASEKVLSLILGNPAPAPLPAAAPDPRTYPADRQVYSPPSSTYVMDNSPYYYSTSAYYYPTYSPYYYSPYWYPRYSGFYPSFSIGFGGGRCIGGRSFVGFGGHVRR